VKKIILILINLVIVNISSFANESDMLNLNAPSDLTEGQSLFSVKHRFIGKVDNNVYDTFFGIDGGANVGLALGHMFSHGIEAKVSRNRYTNDGQSEYVYSLSRQGDLSSHVKGKIGVDYFSYISNNARINDRRENFFYNASLATAPVWDGVSFVFDLAYDGYNEKVGTGIGINKEFKPNLSFLPFVEKMALMAEYYPVIDREDGVTGKKDAFSLGVKFKTAGHHFVLSLGNSTAIGTRQAMLGAINNDLHFGFNIYRIMF